MGKQDKGKGPADPADLEQDGESLAATHAATAASAGPSSGAGVGEPVGSSERSSESQPSATNDALPPLEEIFLSVTYVDPEGNLAFVTVENRPDICVEAIKEVWDTIKEYEQAAAQKKDKASNTALTSYLLDVVSHYLKGLDTSPKKDLTYFMERLSSSLYEFKVPNSNGDSKARFYNVHLGALDQSEDARLKDACSFIMDCEIQPATALNNSPSVKALTRFNAHQQEVLSDFQTVKTASTEYNCMFFSVISGLLIEAIGGDEQTRAYITDLAKEGQPGHALLNKIITKLNLSGVSNFSDLALYLLERSSDGSSLILNKRYVQPLGALLREHLFELMSSEEYREEMNTAYVAQLGNIVSVDDDAAFNEGLGDLFIGEHLQSLVANIRQLRDGFPPLPPMPSSDLSDAEKTRGMLEDAEKTRGMLERERAIASRVDAVQEFWDQEGSEQYLEAIRTPFTFTGDIEAAFLTHVLGFHGRVRSSSSDSPSSQSLFYGMRSEPLNRPNLNLYNVSSNPGGVRDHWELLIKKTTHAAALSYYNEHNLTLPPSDMPDSSASSDANANKEEGKNKKTETLETVVSQTNDSPERMRTTFIKRSQSYHEVTKRSVDVVSCQMEKASKAGQASMIKIDRYEEAFGTVTVSAEFVMDATGKSPKYRVTIDSYKKPEAPKSAELTEDTVKRFKLRKIAATHAELQTDPDNLHAEPLAMNITRLGDSWKTESGEVDYALVEEAFREAGFKQLQYQGKDIFNDIELENKAKQDKEAESTEVLGGAVTNPAEKNIQEVGRLLSPVNSALFTGAMLAIASSSAAINNLPDLPHIELSELQLQASITAVAGSFITINQGAVVQSTLLLALKLGLPLAINTLIQGSGANTMDLVTKLFWNYALTQVFLASVDIGVNKLSSSMVSDQRKEQIKSGVKKGYLFYCLARAVVGLIPDSWGTSALSQLTYWVPDTWTGRLPGWETISSYFVFSGAQALEIQNMSSAAVIDTSPIIENLESSVGATCAASTLPTLVEEATCSSALPTLVEEATCASALPTLAEEATCSVNSVVRIMGDTVSNGSSALVVAQQNGLTAAAGGSGFTESSSALVVAQQNALTAAAGGSGLTETGLFSDAPVYYDAVEYMPMEDNEFARQAGFFGAVLTQLSEYLPSSVVGYFSLANATNIRPDDATALVSAATMAVGLLAAH